MSHRINVVGRWIAVMLFGIGTGFAQSKEPPLPQALIQARTVCLEGKTGDARDTNNLAKELQDWRRLRLGIPGYCDVTFALQQAGPGTRIPGAKYLDSDRDYLVFTVWDYHTGSRLYRDVVEWPLFINPVRSAVKKLRFRMQAQTVDASTPPVRKRMRKEAEYQARTRPN